MKPWAEMTAGARGGVVGVVVAVLAALFYGAWSVRGTGPAVDGEVTGTGTQVAPEAGAAEGEAAGSGEAATGAEATGVEATGAEATGAEDQAAQDGAASDATAGAGATEQAASGEVAAAADAAADAGGAASEGAAEAGSDAAAPEADVAEGAAEADPAAAGAAAEPAAAPAPIPPSFDLVRVERDGSALVAGKAAASSMLSLRITGAEIAAVPADGAGNFVAMFNLAPSPAPRVLSLVMTLADGTEVPAAGSVVIAPTVAPVLAVAAEATGDAGAATGNATGAAPAVEEAPAALLVTEEGAKVLQSAEALPAELVANVTVDTITYTPEGAVQLAGRGTAERSVRIYLDNAQVGGDVSISTAGDWAVTLPEVAPGIYTLRADQVDAAGKVTSRFETPFKRETVEALAAASAGAAEPAAAEPAAGEAGDAMADAAGTEEAGAATEAATVAGDEAAQAEPAGTAEAAVPTTVTVQPGFTLWRIATETLGEGVLYVQVFEANRDQIRDPDLIYPGQVFAIPAAE